MSPRNAESAPTVGQQVRELAQLHVDLARTEMRDGSTRFFWGVFVLAASTCVGTAALGVLVLALYLLLRIFMPPALAAVCAAVVLGVLAAAGFRFGLRLVSGVRSLLLPRTRAMVGELFRWRGDGDRTSS